MGLGLACLNCMGEWPDERSLLDSVARLDAQAWRDLPTFVREVLRDEGAERAMRRILKPLLVAGIQPEIVLTLAAAANSQRAQPMAPAELEDLAVQVAQEIAAELRRGGR